VGGLLGQQGGDVLISESEVSPSKAARTCANVGALTPVAPRGGIFGLGLIDIRIILSGNSRLVPSGLGRTEDDRWRTFGYSTTEYMERLLR
jgi:hypothetical protein